jgi:hypothetical protein
MVGLDIIGTDNVLKYIEVSKLSKFTIDANKSGHFICVFECINSQSNDIAIIEFSKWADFINPNQTYRITLFDVVDSTIDESGVLKQKKTKNKSNKMQATFILNENFNGARATNNLAAPIDEESLIKKISSKFIEEQSNNQILNEIKNLSERLNRMELEELEDEDEPDSNSIAGINSNQIEQIMGLVNLFKNSTNKPAINGVNDPADSVDIIAYNEFKANINKAIKILHKNNTQLDKDLIKLAELSENKPETFKMLLSTLRSM